MSATSTAQRGRVQAETLMVDTCTITRKGTGGGTFDTGTGQTVPTARTTVYAGKCRTQAREVSPLVQAVGDQSVSLMRYTVSIPYDTTAVLVGDLVTVTASLDPGVVGRELSVESVEAGTFVSARRLVCTDNQG